ncbi:MAG: GNAT family N-acetyltransferase [Candidatus Eremiobacter antarcticus]|nr:GNAT family N-acetyltransferase [Candidatus Eremiobacteraeota bacterium]MBC5807544.1 GNAT family N-acetyltransferase [Candidatus Eremiobacteraeota bacterium]
MRPVEAQDLDLLAGWFGHASFAEYWGGVPLSREQVARDLGAAIQETLPDGRIERVQPYIIEYHGEPAGFLQQWSQGEDECGLDIVMAPAYRDRGLGTDALRALAIHLRGACGRRRITVDPLLANARAIRAFAKCGFVPERKWPDHPDGPSLLMVFRG